MISIIVPVYNGENYINKCADALMAQSYKNIQIIFVDDGSSDNTPDILKEIQQRDSRVKILTKENGGVSSARNAGLDVASGEYIMFCDVDDIPHRDWCGELVLCIEKFPDRLPFCAVKNIDLLTNTPEYIFTLSHVQLSDKNYVLLSKEDLPSIDDVGFLYSLWNKIYSAETIKKNCLRFDEALSMGEDVMFNFQYLTHTCGKTIFLNKILYTYVRQNENCLTARNIDKEIAAAEMIFLEEEELFLNLHISDAVLNENFYNLFCDRYINTLSDIFKAEELSKHEKLKKSFKYVFLPGFQHCRSKIDLEKSYHKKLIKIYKSRILTWLYHFRIIYL